MLEYLSIFDYSNDKGTAESLSLVPKTNFMYWRNLTNPTGITKYQINRMYELYRNYRLNNEYGTHPIEVREPKRYPSLRNNVFEKDNFILFNFKLLQFQEFGL
jgi:hypothetical protein